MLTHLKKARKNLEALLVRLGLVVLPYWPRWLILVCARLAGTLGYWLAPGQRRITMANLDIAFGDKKTPAEKKRLARHAFRIMALTFIDYFWFSRRSAGRVAKYVTLDKSISTCYPPPPSVTVTAHFGNWELISRGMAAAGYAHVAVFAPSSNPAVDEYIMRFRTADNAKMIPMRGAVRGLLRALHSGIYIALLLDQNTKPEEGGVFVDFFGLPVPMSTSAAILAQRVNVPISPLFCMTNLDGNYLIYALPPIEIENLPGEGADFVQYYTQKVAAAFQQEIEKHPEQWMWMYKRWKHIKPGAPAGAYPFYSKPMA